MDNYFKFWKHLPKLVLGLFFTLCLVALFIGLDKILTYIKTADVKSINGIFQSVLLILLIFIFSSIGLKIQDLIILLTNKVFVYLFRIEHFRKVFKRLHIDELLKTDGQIAKEVFIQNEKDITEYYYFKSWAQPEVLDKVKGLLAHSKKISEHVKGIIDPEIIVQLDYYGCVAQEQAKRDSLKGEIKEVYYVLLNTFIFFMLLLTNYYSFFLLSICVILFLLANFLLLPVISNLKRKYGYYVIIGYLDTFSVGDNATVVDREPSL